MKSEVGLVKYFGWVVNVGFRWMVVFLIMRGDIGEKGCFEG